MITPSFSLTATERVLPKLALDFTTASLDPRITFTRTTDATHPATYVNSSGYIASAANNAPRFDYTLNTGGACKGLLIEESRANLCTYSNDLTQSVYTKINTTAALTATGPDNVANSATTLTATVANSNTSLSLTSASAARITSVYAKRRTGSGKVYLTQGETTGSELVTNGDFSSGTTGWTADTNATIANVSNQLVITTVANGASGAYTTISTTIGNLYKITFQYVNDSTAGNTFFYAGSTVGSANAAYFNMGSTIGTKTIYFVANATTMYLGFYSSSGALAGNTNTFDNVSCFQAVGVDMTSAASWTRFETTAATLTNPTITIIVATNGNAVDIYGLQHELGSFSTSLIPTSGSSLTRNADVATMTGTNFSDWFNASEGTFKIKFIQPPAANKTMMSVNDGTSRNRLLFYSGSGLVPYFVVSSANVNVVNLSKPALISGTTNTASFAYKQDSFAYTTNANGTSADTSGNVPVSPIQMQIGAELTTYLSSYVQLIEYWPQRCTNNEVQAFSKG